MASSSRYIRPSKVPRLVLQERDLAMIEAVARFGHMTAEQLAALYFPGRSLRSAQARLRLLWSAGYLERMFLPRLVGDERPLYCGRPLYRVGALGRRLLRDEGRSAAMRRPGSSATVEHDLVATELLVALISTAKMRPDFTVQTWTESELWTVLAEQRQRSARPALVSDGAFTITQVGAKPLSFHIEVVRADVRGGNQSLARRMQRYASLARAGYFCRVFGQQTLRAVLFMAPTEARAQHLRELAEALPHGRRMFWFTSYEEGEGPARRCRFGPEHIFKHRWLDGTGSSWSLHRTKQPS